MFFRGAIFLHLEERYQDNCTRGDGDINAVKWASLKLKKPYLLFTMLPPRLDFLIGKPAVLEVPMISRQIEVWYSGTIGLFVRQFVPIYVLYAC